GSRSEPAPGGAPSGGSAPGAPAADPRGGWQRSGAAGDAVPAVSPESRSAPAARGDDTSTPRAVRPRSGEPTRAATAGASSAPAPAPVPAPAPAPAPEPAPAPAPAGPAASEPPGGWAQQVRELAQPAGSGPGQGAGAGAAAALGWKPPVNDPFLQAAQEQARPAGLGRRFAARLIDSVLHLAVAGAVAAPFVPKALDHWEAQVDAAEQAGVTREIWLIDGTTGGYLAVVLGALLVFGLLYEVLPVARWGRTLGKKLCGVEVLRVEEQTAPGFGPAAVRWLLHSVLSVLGVGVVNVAWCLFDRPWRQCWHDKAARTFVARRARGSVRLG
ncbi:RDD family protein, partial [Streptomyces sp. JJ38]|uniref:RDD family protein n=1 Tax=Streptomyces sp. JJ38 TaxID=2738128 RepID=UPI0027D7A71B